MAIAKREKIIHYFLLVLILSFFLFPLFVSYCLDCKVSVTKKIASLLLFFYR